MIIKMYNGFYPHRPSSGLPPQVASMPNSLYHSLKGQYFVGYADNLYFEKNNSAWAALINPSNSTANLFVNIWTVSDLAEPPIRLQVWLNSVLPGNYTRSELVVPANTALRPVPKPQVQLIKASNVSGAPQAGIKAFSRRSVPGETIVSDEEGKFIIPPGGNFAIFLSNTEGSATPANVRIAYGWWEERGI